MWGAHFCSVQNGLDRDVLLVIKPLSLRDRNFVEFIYDQAAEEARALEIITEIELRTRLKRAGVWDENNDKIISSTITRIKELKENLGLLSGRKFHMTTSLINSYEDTLKKELSRKSSFFHISAEQYASDARSNAIVYCSIYDDFDKRHWDTWDDFGKETDLEFTRNVITKINDISIYSTKEIRVLARSPEWRFIWMAAKTNIETLFNKPLGDLDLNQKNLLYWSQVYDSVYEAYERPSDEIINDDDALDKWFDNQSKKRKQEVFEKDGSVSKIKLSNKMRGHGEVFIMANPSMNPDSKYRQEAPTTPDIQNIEGMNTEFVRNFKRSEQKKIKKKKMVNEKDLRGRGNKIARKIIGSNDAVIGKRDMGGKGSRNKVLPGGTL